MMQLLSYLIVNFEVARLIIPVFFVVPKKFFKAFTIFIKPSELAQQNVFERNVRIEL